MGKAGNCCEQKVSRTTKMLLFSHLFILFILSLTRLRDRSNTHSLTLKAGTFVTRQRAGVVQSTALRSGFGTDGGRLNTLNGKGRKLKTERPQLP